MKLHCTHCNYTYSPRTGKIPQKCPYCNSNDTIEEVKNMQAWINEFSTDRETQA